MPNKKKEENVEKTKKENVEKTEPIKQKKTKTTQYDVLTMEVKALEKQEKLGKKGNKIINVEVTTSHEFYESEEYPLRKGYLITLDDDTKYFLAMPKRLKGSNLLAFKNKYGDYPKKGLTVEVDISGQFQKIII